MAPECLVCTTSFQVVHDTFTWHLDYNSSLSYQHPICNCAKPFNKALMRKSEQTSLLYSVKSIWLAPTWKAIERHSTGMVETSLALALVLVQDKPVTHDWFALQQKIDREKERDRERERVKKLRVNKTGRSKQIWKVNDEAAQANIWVSQMMLWKCQTLSLRLSEHRWKKYALNVNTSTNTTGA